ncbi:MAG: cell division FtsZ family protein, partial [Endomicrobium sp.]|jgi:cell division protein FtsZ|nr:cell division FtsZ family protein [Endomicrobium sp.]
MVFVTAGMGGGTGTGSAPTIAKIAKEEGILTVGVVTKPFLFEGEMKMKQAEEGIANLAPYVDALITISNEKVFHINNMIDDKTPWKVLFGFIDDVLRRSIQSITDMITLHGEMNIDFKDVENALKNSKTALIGIGESSGDVREAFEKAIENPMTEKFDISAAKCLLVNIEGNASLSTKQVKDFGDRIHDFGVNKNCFVKQGLRVDNKLDNKIKITILAAGSQSDINKTNYEEPPKGQISFDDIDSSKDASKIDFSKPAYIYWKIEKLK